MRRGVSAIGLVIALLASLAVPSTADQLAARVMERAKARQWVTAAVSYTSVDLGVHQNLVAVNIGGTVRTLSIGEPPLGVNLLSLSRGGTKLAFIRFVSGMGAQGRKLCVMDVSGSRYEELLGADAVAIAWSHDERRLAFRGGFVSDSARRPSAVIVMDFSSRPPKVLLERPTAFGPDGAGSLTSQAWSPDNRRLVYKTRDQEMAILDVETGQEEKLGRGHYPAWSPDGRFIAYMAYGEPSHPFGKNYQLLALKDHKDKRILSNRRSVDDFFAGRGDFFYAPLWSPDGEFLLVQRSRGTTSGEELVEPWVIDVASGKVEALPLGSMGDMNSWGGRP